MNKYKLTDIVTALMDCFGYSEQEFEGVDKATVISYMSEDQKAIVKSYLA